MKVLIAGHSLLPLRRRLEREGCTITKNSNEADLLFLDGVHHVDSSINPRRCVMSGREIPRVLLEQMRFGIAEAQAVQGASQVTHFLMRWHEPLLDEQSPWGNQTYAGILVDGMMNGNLGAPSVTASAFRGVDQAVGSSWFESPYLEVVLKEWKHRGMVSILFSGEKVLGIQTGVPFYSFFGLMELVKSGFVAGELASGKPEFHQAWTCSSLYSRHPFPTQVQKLSIAKVSGLNDSREKHFWTWPLVNLGHGDEASAINVIGIATAWSRSQVPSALKDACWRVMDICRNVKVEGGQYRTDLAEVVEQKWIEARTFLTSPQASIH